MMLCVLGHEPCALKKNKTFMLCWWQNILFNLVKAECFPTSLQDILKKEGVSYFLAILKCSIRTMH
jgi:hypothetical protein